MYFVVNKLMRTTAMTAVSFLTVIGYAYAADVILPVNGQVVGGAATISNSSPNKMDIYQTTNRAVISWDSFNISENGTVQFYQPDANSWVINRVVGNNSDPTKILGTLKANGGVMVLDRNGVIFGKNAIVDVGSIIASTGDINTNVFMHGDTKFNITGVSGSATVRNDGRITVADGGLAALVAPMVRNDGTITAHAGKIALASGKQVAVDFYGDNLLNLTVAPDSADARIINNGTLDAAGGRVEVKMDISRAADILSSVVNNKGVLHASTARMVGNKIVLSAGNAPVTVQGDIQSGKTVSVKGGMVDVRAGSSINAGSAHETGDVVVMGTKKLTFNGYINANYGSIQTSGTTGLAIGKSAEVHGSNWLIGSPSVNIRDEAESGAIYVDALEDALNEGMDVTLRAVKAQGMKGNIDLYTPLDWSGEASLVLDAAGDIHFRNDAGITAEDKADITLKAGDDIRFTKLLGGGISTNGGNINLSSGDLTVLLANNIVNAHGGNITIDNKGALLAETNTIVTEGHGTITVNQNKTKEILSALLKSLYSLQDVLDAIANKGEGLNKISLGAGGWEGGYFFELHKNNVLISGAQAGIEGSLHKPTNNTYMYSNDYGWQAMTIMSSNNVTIDGVDFYYEGLVIGGSSNITITNGKFYSPRERGIYVSGTSDLVISNNWIDSYSGSSTHTDVGIWLKHLNGENVIYNNMITNVDWMGIYAEGNVGNLEISNNTIENSSREAISLYDVQGAISIEKNYLYNALFSGVEVYQSKQPLESLNILNNTIDGSMTGMRISGVQNAVISDNVISNSDTGLYVVWSNENPIIITNNLINNIEDFGLYLSGYGVARVSDNIFQNIGYQEMFVDGVTVVP